MRNRLPVHWRDTISDVKDSVTDLIRRWRSNDSSLLMHNDTWPASMNLWSGWPVVEVDETEDAVKVRAELPGMSEKDFQVEVDGQRLILHGEKQHQDEKKQGAYHYTECRYGSFYRAIPLPCEVELDKADAKYRHGVLRVNLPKTAEARARTKRIEVH